MQQDLNFDQVKLYLLKKVIVTFSDGTHVSGLLAGIIAATNQIIVDSTMYSLNDVSDIEMVGSISYHTYHKDKAKACEIDGLFFGLADLVPDTDRSRIIYGEFDCTGACHLVFADSMICAKDVRILSCTHKHHWATLVKSLYMYVLRNGAPVVGTLLKTETGYMVNTPSGQSVEILFEDVEDLIRIPLVNESVSITVQDGSVFSGTVSAANESAVVVVSDTVQIIMVPTIKEIRYKGVVSFGLVNISGKTVKQVKLSLGVKDEQFLCKLPYLRSREDENALAEGISATFIPGVTEKGIIAKDVVLDIVVPKVTDHTYYGIVLTVDFTKENGFGYIGNRYVAKACGKPVSGNARFQRSQLTFDIEFNRAYIIKYTATEDPGKNLRIVKSMEVHKVLDISKFGFIYVTDDGQIDAIPLFKAAIDRFLNRDVDVIRSNGDTVSGLLQNADETKITVVQGVDEAEQQIYEIPFDEIRDILLVGTVTQYYPNGTGYVDNSFFFHINEMERSIDAQFVRPGTQFIFSLRNARKGNFLDCGNIKVLHEKKLDVFVLSYQDKKYTVVDMEKYGKSVNFIDNAYEVPYSSYNQFRDLKNEDYHAILTLIRKAGVMECAYIRTIANQPKLRRGIVTNVNEQNKTVSILAPELYRKSNEAKVFPLAMRSNVERMSNPMEKDYDVLYSLSVQNREYCVTIAWVDMKNTYDKCYFGYLERYMEDRDHGFITPEEIYIQWPRPRNHGVYCRLSTFVNPPDIYNLIDTKYVYRVCYTLSSNSSARYERPPAQKVWFLEKTERQTRPAPAPTPEPPVIPSMAVEEITLSAAYPPPSEDRTNLCFGLVTAFSPKFDKIRIFKDFKNKKLPEVDENYQQQLFMDIPTAENNVQFSGISQDRINAPKNVYLVRFAVNTAEDGTPVFDKTYPLEFLREFRKNTLRILTVEGDKMYVETGPVPQKAPTSPLIPAPEGVTSYVPGETVLIRHTGQDWVAADVDTVNDDRIVLTDGQVVNPAETDIVRFGVITSFNDNMTLGMLNGRTPFSFANVDPRTFNMVKAARKQQLVWYTCRDNIVTYVERFTPDFLNKLPFPWQYGTVSDYVDAPEKRCILVNDNIHYLLTVATGGYIWALIKSNTLVGTSVFVKVIRCPYETEEGIEIRQCALDIHSEEEVAVIRYDAVSDSYLAAQSTNAAQAVAVDGNRNVLSSLVDSQSVVTYRITEDGKKLRAYIDKAEAETEWVEEVSEEDLEASKVLLDSGLVQFQLARVNLTTMQIPDDIELALDGWPVDHENTINLIRHLAKKTGRAFDFKKQIAVIPLLERLPDELKDEALKELDSRSVETLLWKLLTRQIRSLGLQNDCLWGEYSYYITTLLRDIHSLERQKEEIYKLFLQDFYSRIEVMEVLRQIPSNPRERRKIRYNLQALFKRNVLADNIGQLAAHMISLDETSIQHLIITEDIFEQNPVLAKQLLDWGKTVDNTQNFDSAAVLIDHLRSLYKNDKSRYTRELVNAANGLEVLKNAERILKNISGRFMLLFTSDDAQRFTALHELCQNVISNRYAGYHRYQSALASAWTKCSDLLHASAKQLTQETTDMLLRTGLIEAVLREIGTELNSLYANPDFAPDVRCASNDSEVVPSQTNLILLVENGTPGRTNLQSAYNIKLHLEVLGGLSADSIPSLITLPEKVLPGGADTVVLDNIPIDLSTLDGDMFSISVSAEYECCSGFDNGDIRETRTADCGILEFQLLSGQNIVKNPNAENYYLHPAEGNPLKETSKDDCSMFFGRKEELKNIWDSIVDENQVLREGRAIMLYGQKKCGKTSLINQIIGRMRIDSSVSRQAIIISIKDILECIGGVTCLDDFSLNFYQYILDEFEDAVNKNHEDLADLLMDNDLEIPLLLENPSMAPALFQRFFRKFAALDRGRHRVVLVMDEFTRLCTTILSRKDVHPEYQGIPNFIKLFSSMGFVQIIIGHPNMMRALSQLGIINHTAEFAKRIELSALKEDDARQLICEPMVRSFGYDVYQTVLGKRAIEKLLALSGCHPSVLMKLCDQMFKHFVTTSHSQILIHDVEKMLHTYLPQLEASTTFDIMVAEDGDATAFFDSLPTYRYLKTVATESLRSNNRDCDINFICQELGEEGSKEIREILISRRVLEAGNGRIRIPIELFLEYIRYMYETH